MKQRLLEKIEDKSLVMGVIGLGYVGLPLAAEKAGAGFKTIGFDISEKRIKALTNGENYIGEVTGSELFELIQSERLVATYDFSRLSEVDFVAVCVPTPLDCFRQPDLSYIKSSAETIAKHLHRGMAVVMESTTYPGTTQQLIQPILEKISGLKGGEDFYLGFSPERVDVGNLRYNVKNTPKVVSGIDEDSAEVIAKVYQAVLSSEVFVASSPIVAEMEKLLENSYRCVNIALINELAMLCRKMGVDIWEVIAAAKTKPYGFEAFYPGIGPGGHCIPVDPCYLSWKAREYNFHTTVIDCAAAVNDFMPQYCIGRISAVLGKRHISINGAKILLLGIAYKQDVADCRESPALKLMSLLENEGARVSFYDPFVPCYETDNRVISSERELGKELLQGCDIAVVSVAHSCIDYERVAHFAPCVLDIKNAMSALKHYKNIETL